MTQNKFTETVKNIDPSKKCLQFLAERIVSENYRGIQISQHNRYDVNFIFTLLAELYTAVGKDLMAIRTTDLSKRPNNTDNEIVYANYVTNVNKKLGRCTQDSVRKNFFVDLHRMGFIYRYDKNKNKIEVNTGRNIHYVSLTELGIQFVKTENIFERNVIYTKTIDTISQGLPSLLLDSMFELKTIDEYEFMFFVSFIGCTLGTHTYTISELISFLLEYRSLSRFQKTAIIETVQDYCTPENFAGDKTHKRDFHNWKNETQQIFMLLNQTIYFERENLKNNSRLKMKVAKDAAYESEKKLLRSTEERKLYFINHKIEKTKGFELHHIVPLLLAHSKNEFDILDVWENMLYIDGKTHSIITQTGNKTIKLNFVADDIELTAPAKNVSSVYCKKDENVLYNTSHKKTMSDYNETILNEV